MEPEQPLRGVDLARRALAEAKAAAKARGKGAVAQPSQRKGVGGEAGHPLSMRRSNANRRTWSGAGPDERDPQRLGSLTAAVSNRRGWADKVVAGTVLGCWDAVVGADIASRAQPVSLAGGVLSVTAESTAWATQLRMAQSEILRRIAVAVGHGVVRQLRITGPAAPSWRMGERHLRGLGPRDTYG